jgi:hypothetical protein
MAEMPTWLSSAGHLDEGRKVYAHPTLTCRNLRQPSD